MSKIAKLTEVDVRELWKHEQHDFSKWLAEPENIEELDKILGLTLVDVEQEVLVGGRRCGEFSERFVVIDSHKLQRFI
jgi:hypothetical protein